MILRLDSWPVLIGPLDVMLSLLVPVILYTSTVGEIEFAINDVIRIRI